MHSRSFLLASVAALTATPSVPRPGSFDLTRLAPARDSFTFVVHGATRGYAVWQYRVQGGQLIFTAHSALEPVEEESLRVVLDRASGAPVASFHHLEILAPGVDTVLREHDLRVAAGRVEGRRRFGTRSGGVTVVPVRHGVAPGTVWSDYQVYAAPALAIAPGDTVLLHAYSEMGDSLLTLRVIAEPPRPVTVPAGTFEVLPLRGADYRLYVTRAAPWRVVRGESLLGEFTFDLASTGPPQP